MKFKTILDGRFLPVLLASGILFIAGCDNKDAELAAQRQKELEAVRAELEHSKTSAAAQENELARLRKDNLELLRLRNEIRQMRDDKKQLTQQAQAAQAKVQQAQAKVQAVQSEAQQAAQALATQQHALTCINSLRQLDGAKQQWALEKKKDANAVPQPNEIVAYLKGGFPRCPLSGGYTLNAVGVAPTCTIPGHALP
jgi:septal ring factor EnvC (AmiA/AmiB activator)